MNNSMIFVNLPVTDDAASRRFFEELGYEFEDGFCEPGKAHCMRINPTTYAMLLERKFFGEFVDSPASPEKGPHEVLVGLSVESRAAVDEMIEKAVRLGAKEVESGRRDFGFMYQRSFADLDGHVWEYIYMDPEAAQARANRGDV